jgi:hypothetical protein
VELGGVVAGVEVVGADDRDDEDALDAALSAGLLEVARRGREELGCFPLVRGRVWSAVSSSIGVTEPRAEM